MIDVARRGCGLLGGILALLMAIVVPIAPAEADCAASAAPSAHRFTGVVVTTRSHDRIATVRTEAGATVVVRGTVAQDDDGYTSVDRTYEQGARYEFHPNNASSPFMDSICSATRLLARAMTPMAQASPPAGAAGDGDADRGRHRNAPWWALGPALVLATVAATGWRRGARSSGDERTV